MNIDEQNKKSLENLKGFFDIFMEMKNYLVDLNLPYSDDYRLAVEHLDDGFLRAREAIFVKPIPNDVKLEAVN